MGFSLGKLNPLANTGINKKASGTVQTLGGITMSLATAGQSNKLTSKSAQASNLGQVSTVAGKVAAVGTALVVGGSALTGGLTAAGVAGNSAAQTTGAEAMATIETTSSTPTIYEQLKGIVAGGVTTATGNAVTRATSPKPAPTPSERVAAAAQSVPVWGWVLGALGIAGLVFMVARK